MFVKDPGVRIDLRPVVSVAPPLTENESSTAIDPSTALPPRMVAERTTPIGITDETRVDL